MKISLCIFTSMKLAAVHNINMNKIRVIDILPIFNFLFIFSSPFLYCTYIISYSKKFVNEIFMNFSLILKVVCQYCIHNLHRRFVNEILIKKSIATNTILLNKLFVSFFKSQKLLKVLFQRYIKYIKSAHLYQLL